MNCRLFQRWLEDGMLEQTAHGAHDHAASGKLVLPATPWLDLMQRVDVATGLAFGLLPVAGMLGWLAYRSIERLARGRVHTPRMPLGIAV